MKKVISLVIAIMMVLSLAACGSSQAPANTTPTGYTYKVAIVQQLDHSSLDEIRIAITAQLESLAKEKGIGIYIQDYNGQNDASALNQIGTQVVSDGFDIIIPIATTAALSGAKSVMSCSAPK